MKKRYVRLRRELYGYGYTMADVAGWLGKSMTYVCQRFWGQRPWSQEDMYTILERLHIDASKMAEYFPRIGTELPSIDMMV